MSEYENAIELSGVTKRYEGFMLDNVSFTVPKGCIMGFIGQNGLRYKLKNLSSISLR